MVESGVIEDKSLRIFHIVRRAEGGIRRHVIELLSGLRGQFKHILAASPEFYQSLPDGLLQSIDFVPFDIGDGAGIGYIPQLYRLAGHVRREKPDIIHCHGYKAVLPGIICSKLFGTGLVITGHNLFPANAPKPAKILIKFAGRASNRMIAVSPSLKASLVAAGVEDQKIKVIPNGIDLSGYGNVERDAKNTVDELGIDAASEVILTVARLTAVKGIETLVRAVPIIAERHPNVKVLIAGDGPDRQTLAELAERAADGRVVFLGHRRDVPQLLAAADVVAIPSLSEGHPLILIEAMASKKPVVASSVGGLADTLRDGDTGVLVPPADPKALAEGIVSVLDSPDLVSRLSQSARRYAEEEFSVEKMIADTKEVYLCAAV
ncbi:MAG: glycosyltransferase family 4 protein [Armatimonadota bacterium]